MTLMNAEIYNHVEAIVIALLKASDEDDSISYWNQYERLEKVCAEAKHSVDDHPYQWETLADFTVDDKVALKIYERAFTLAEKESLNDYLATLSYAMAERHNELENFDKALQCAKSAQMLASLLDDEELQHDIRDLLKELSE